MTVRLVPESELKQLASGPAAFQTLLALKGLKSKKKRREPLRSFTNTTNSQAKLTYPRCLTDMLHKEANPETKRITGSKERYLVGQNTTCRLQTTAK